VFKNEKYYSDLDLQLQDLAAADWPAFVMLIGEDQILKAKICMLRSKGRSLNQIANKLSIPKHKVEYQCKICRNLSDDNTLN